MLENLTLCVHRTSSKQDPFQPVIVHSLISEDIAENHVIIRVDRFGFSANNITYQALGEAPHFRYFDFHAAPSAQGISAETHGVIPVWGFGVVIKSTHPRIQIGERVYGYLAPTRYLLLPVSPSNVNRFSFSVPRPHLPPDRRPYNQITRCATDAQYAPSPLAEDMTMLYRPLFWTAYWCEDWLNASVYRGASRILISSASAKTAFCLAYLIGKRVKQGTALDIKLVALTSKTNLEFTRNLGLYDEVVEYNAIDGSLILSSGGHSWLYIDVAGNSSLNGRIQHLFSAHPSESLVGCIQLGLTNLSPSAPNASTMKFTTNTSPELPKDMDGSSQVTVEQFFMPEWLAVRRKQLAVSQITAMQANAWRNLMQDGMGWVKIVRMSGATAVERAYREVATRGTDPKTGMIWSLWEAGTDFNRIIPSRL